PGLSRGDGARFDHRASRARAELRGLRGRRRRVQRGADARDRARLAASTLVAPRHAVRGGDLRHPRRTAGRQHDLSAFLEAMAGLNGGAARLPPGGKYLLLLSVHGLVRGTNIELGRDADTGGQVKYVVELARALGADPRVD